MAPSSAADGSASPLWAAMAVPVTQKTASPSASVTCNGHPVSLAGLPQEDQSRCRKRDSDMGEAGECGGRVLADDDVAQHTAADRGHHGQHGQSHYVELFLYRDQCRRHRECQGAQVVKNHVADRCERVQLHGARQQRTRRQVNPSCRAQRCLATETRPTATQISLELGGQCVAVDLAQHLGGIHLGVTAFLE